MGKLRVNVFAVSLDGFGAGPDQCLQDPLGKHGTELMQWFFPTATFVAMHGGAAKGTTGVDDDFARCSFENVGAWIMGRNMFGPIRGAWPDDNWRGWWGDNPPYHVPVFVLTHHARKPLSMDGGTTFHFVTGGADEALRRAREAAGARDVRVGGGTSTIRHYLQARQIDEMHMAISPTLLGRGEPVFQGLDLRALGYRVTRHVPGEGALHIVIARA